jgi:hypothetical protein
MTGRPPVSVEDAVTPMIAAFSESSARKPEKRAEELEGGLIEMPGGDGRVDAPSAVGGGCVGGVAGHGARRRCCGW